MIFYAKNISFVNIKTLEYDLLYKIYFLCYHQNSRICLETNFVLTISPFLMMTKHLDFEKKFCIYKKNISPWTKQSPPEINN